MKTIRALQMKKKIHTSQMNLYQPCLQVSNTIDRHIICLEDPAELVFEKGVQDMNDFLHKVKEFEKITNSHFEDKWKIKDLAFQPLKV